MLGLLMDCFGGETIIAQLFAHVKSIASAQFGARGALLCRERPSDTEGTEKFRETQRTATAERPAKVASFCCCCSLCFSVFLCISLYFSVPSVSLGRSLLFSVSLGRLSSAFVTRRHDCGAPSPLRRSRRSQCGRAAAAPAHGSRPQSTTPAGKRPLPVRRRA